MRSAENLTLPSLRDSLLKAIRSQTLPFPQEILQNLRFHLDELSSIVHTGAWRATMALAGQLAEGMLRERLFLEGIPREELTNSMFGPMLQRARTMAILPDADSHINSSRPFGLTLRLRNWSSHLNFSHTPPSEIRATQAIALAACAAEYFFPRQIPLHNKPPQDADEIWWQENWNTVAPGTLVTAIAQSRLKDLIASEAITQSDIFEKIIRFGTSNSVADLIGVVHKECLDEEMLAKILTSLFGDVAMGCSRSSLLGLVDLPWRLRKMGLEDHAKVVAGLLPISCPMLSQLLQSRSLAWTARYLHERYNADPPLFRSLLLDKNFSDDQIANALWTQPANRNFSEMNILNIANIISLLPRTLQESVLRNDEASCLHDWIKVSDVNDASNLLKFLCAKNISENKDLKIDASQLVHEIADEIRKAKIGNLHGLPLRLARFHIEKHPFGIEIVKSLLDNVRGSIGDEESLHAISRVLWDSAQYSDTPEIQAQACQLAARAFSSVARDKSAWPRLCLAGMLCVFEEPLPAEASYFTEILQGALDKLRESLVSKIVSRWEKFLAIVALDTLEIDLQKVYPIELFVKLTRETTNAQTDVSKRLLALTRKVIDSKYS